MRAKTLIACLFTSFALITAPAIAQTAYKAPRTTDGRPDLQGAWSNATLTPLERVTDYGERIAMTEEEANKAEGKEADYLASHLKPTDPNATVADLPSDCGRGFVGVSCGYSHEWTDPGSTIMRVGGQPRTSFITSTRNGRIPPRKDGAAATPRSPLPAGMRQNDNPEGRSLGERCLTSFGNSAGPVMLPLLYNNTYQFVQSKDAVAILVEMVHDVRVVRLHAKHRTDGVRPWMGDSIGWYEGDTLVVETTNYHPSQSFRGSSENLKVTERFTRTAADRILYQFKVEDPTVWIEAWGGEYEFGRSKGDVYEYACHEGNYGLPNILAGARAEDQETAAR